MKPNDLIDPHLLHLFLGHLPVAGLVFGLVALTVSLLYRHDAMRVLALAIIIAGALSFWPARLTGDRSFDTISKAADPRGQEWLDEHVSRADSAQLYYYGLAALAALAMAVRPIQSGLFMLMTTATFLGTVIMVAVGYWIGSAGMGVSHHDVRIYLKHSQLPGREMTEEISPSDRH